MQKISRTILNNGLTVIFSNDPRYTTSTILFGFKIGWLHDKKGEEGLAHLFEHLVGKRTIKYPNKGELEAQKEVLGITGNATTYADFTYYYFNQLNHNLLKATELIFETIYHSFFNDEDLKLEKNVVLTEGNEYKENDYQLLSYNSRKLVYGKSPQANFFFGDKKSLKNISLNTFSNFYNHYKNPENAVIVVACNTDQYNQEILNYIQNYYKNLELLFEKVNISEKNPDFKIKSKTRKFKSKGQIQAGVLFSFALEKQLSLKEKIQYKFIESLLANSHSAKLLNKLRDGLGLIYWLDMYSINWKDSSEIIIYTKTDKKNVKLLVQEAKKVIEKLQKEIRELDLNGVVERIKFDVVNGITSLADSQYIFETTVIFGEHISTENFLKIIEETTIGEFKNLINKLLDFKKLNISILT
jgi:predicted Zn-dependent peptidase